MSSWQIMVLFALWKKFQFAVCIMSVFLQNCSRHLTAKEAEKNVQYVCYLTHYFKTFIWKAKKAKGLFVCFVLSSNVKWLIVREDYLE